MTRSAIPTVVVLLLLAVACVARAQYSVGFGQVDLSPSADQLANREVWQGGYGFWKFRGAPTGVHDPIWAKAVVVLGANSTSAALVVLDSTGASNRILKAIREGVQGATGIPATHVLVSATHTHSGPDLQGLWGFVSDAYRQQVIDGAVQAIVNAHRSAVPARLLLSKGVGSASNRRDWGYTDTELTVLDAVDAATGQRIGTLINFAAHPVTLGSSNLEFSSDYCHYTRERAEGSLGAPVVYVNGAIGDVSPQGTGSGFDRAQSYGYEIADVAVAAIAAGQEEVSGDFRVFVDTQLFTHPVSNPAFKLAFKVGMLDYDYNDDDSITTQASYVRIGNLVQGVAFPGESLTRNGLPIKEAMVAPYRFFFGLNGDTLGV